MFACSNFYFRLQLSLIIIHITCISLSLHQTSGPIYLTSVLGVLGTQETSCILIAGLLKRDIFDLFLPEFNKPWVIHLRETCCCSTNLYTWRPNTFYKNRSVRRHHASSSSPALARPCPHLLTPATRTGPWVPPISRSGPSPLLWPATAGAPPHPGATAGGAPPLSTDEKSNRRRPTAHHRRRSGPSTSWWTWGPDCFFNFI
jgi:hypothetical protein